LKIIKCKVNFLIFISAPLLRNDFMFSQIANGKHHNLTFVLLAWILPRFFMQAQNQNSVVIAFEVFIFNFTLNRLQICEAYCVDENQLFIDFFDLVKNLPKQLSILKHRQICVRSVYSYFIVLFWSTFKFYRPLNSWLFYEN